MNYNISVIGLGYVGFPLFKLLYEKYKDTVCGIDTNTEKINLLKKEYKTVSNSYESLKISDIVIIAVPTPINDTTKKPDLSCLNSVKDKLKKYILQNSHMTIVLESTVYPGYTDEFIKDLETTGKKNLIDFKTVYSPERVSPGEPDKDLLRMKKLIASDNKDSLNIIDNLYSSIGINTYIIDKGKDSFKIAEMSKILENVQRDVNISVMNEFKMICNNQNISISFSDVLDAAETKNGFCKFHPGFVGGHCIAVDPYYLIDSTNILQNSVISSARCINEYYIEYYSNIIEKYDIKKASILGMSYKQNIEDSRESGGIKLYNYLKEKYKDSIQIFCVDPYIEKYNIDISIIYDSDIVFFVIPHDWFYLNLDFGKFSNNTKFVDITNDIRNRSNLDDFKKRIEFIN